MKKHILFCLFTFFYISTVLGQNMSSDEAIKVIEKYYKNTDYSVYASKNLIEKHTPILCMDTIFSPDFNSWFIFIDENPGENWGHACKLIFINPDNGEYKTIEHTFPPDISEMTPVKQKSFNIKVSDSDYLNFDEYKSKSTSHISKSTSSEIDHSWAVILSGGAKKSMNYERYWNDCSIIFSTLKYVYGYKQNNIKVLISDGTDSAHDRYNLLTNTYDSSPLDLDGDGVNDTQYAATKANLRSAFNQISSAMEASSITKASLFIFVTDHGGRNSNGESYICLWNEEKLTASEFYSLILENFDKRNILVKINIVMGQCNSGGFADLFRSKANRRTVISTACSATQSSYATTNLLYDEFLFHWTAAMRKKNVNNSPVNADLDGDGFVNFTEAHTYAINNDFKAETPQYYDNNGMGLNRSLFGDIDNSGERPIVRPTINLTVISNNTYYLTTDINEDEVNVVKSLYDEICTYSLQNANTGSIVTQGKVNINGGTLDFSNYSKGVYFLSININKNIFDTRKLIIK